MAKIKKKGQAGQAKNYVTRTQAVKKLQISLPDFRKLCIWKGIYPREPRNKKKVSKSSTASTTFYYTKDIQYILHEPLLQKIREQKVLEKKISKALGRGDVSDAARFERHAKRPDKTGKPRYTLDHVIRERYPTFIDALRDLDDCLSMLFLFANLPASTSVPAKMIARCERLCMEFQHYLIVSHSLRRSFLSIKGIYYQATIQGEDILWVVPYKFNQRVVGDVDFRIMGTFVEFYMSLLSFVNYRLYTSVGLKYPPRFDESKDEQAGELGAFTLEGTNITAPEKREVETKDGKAKTGPDPKVQAEVDKLVEQLQQDEWDANKSAESGTVEEEEEMSSEGIDKFEPAAPGGDILPQPSYGGIDAASLFANCTFFLSREVPRQPLEFILRAFGCKRIGWDAVLGEGAFTTNESEPSITHQIIDRPLVQATMNPERNGQDNQRNGQDNQAAQRIGTNVRNPGRIYVQPQWVWDSVNDEELKSPDLYAPDAQLPPHLSPFVKPTQGQYDPTLPLEQQETEAEALQADLAADDEDEEDEEDEGVDEQAEDDFAVEKIIKGIDPGMDVASSGEEEHSEQENEDDTFGGFSDQEEEEDEEELSEAMQRQRELEAEITGNAVKAGPVSGRDKAKLDALKALEKKAHSETEDLERAKGMLSKKKRKLFEQMQYTNCKKSAADLKLRAKRRKLEKGMAKKA